MKLHGPTLTLGAHDTGFTTSAGAVAPRAVRRRSAVVLPGFGLSMGYTVFYLGLIVLLPWSSLVFKSATLDAEHFLAAVSAPRVLASYRLTFGAALAAACVNAVFGLIVAWVLVRCEFFDKRLFDATGARRNRTRIRGSRRVARGEPAADLRARDLSGRAACVVDRLCARVRAWGWRIRIGDLHRREHADGLRDHATDHHHQSGSNTITRAPPQSPW